MEKLFEKPFYVYWKISQFAWNKLLARFIYNEIKFCKYNHDSFLLLSIVFLINALFSILSIMIAKLLRKLCYVNNMNSLHFP